jgi:hypothetical protein
MWACLALESMVLAIPASSSSECRAVSSLVFKKLAENKSASSNPAGFRKNRLNSVKTDRNPFDSKFE